MIRKAFKTCAAGLAAGLGLLGGALPAMGQTPPTTGVPGDWPNLGAFNNRQGRNVSPYVFNSGTTNLRYATQSNYVDRTSILLDNTDLQANAFSNGGPYDDPAGGAATAAGAPLSFVSVSSAAAWPVPATADDEATTPYTLAIRARSGVQPFNYTTRTTEYFTAGVPTPTNQAASYNFAYCVPSAAGGDGTTAATGTASYFQWKFVPFPGTGRNYAVYAYLPLGPTRSQLTATGASTYRYPQRYFMYEIRFGPDRDGNGIPDNRIVDRLDTERQGGGFVRLGVTDNEENTYFPSDGTPIQIRLYNTVPRDSGTGKLLITNPNNLSEADLAASHLVYADAALITPYSGTFAASPTTATISGNTTNATIGSTVDVNGVLHGTPDAGNEDPTADWNVTAARTTFSYNFTNTSISTSADEGRTVNGTLVPGTDGEVVNYQANPLLWPATSPYNPFEKWHYSIAQNAATTATQDDDTAGTTASGGFTLSATSATDPTPLNPNHIGGNYRTATPVYTGTTPPTDPTATVTYKPDLADGDYDIYAYIPGDYTSGATPELYATGVQYSIVQGSTVVYSGTIDESQPLGWYHLGGNRRFANTQTALPNEPLSVIITNGTTVAGDVAAGRKVYADALRFVGQTNSSFTSTPVHATVGILQPDKSTVTDTRVVLVADENGRIHCLDEAGRGDGTTTEYWSYPTTIPGDLSASNPYQDPNLTELGALSGSTAAGTLHGPDGTYNPTLGALNTPTAKMPTGFDLSTAAIQRVNDPANPGATVDVLYIGSTNGKVYCINMKGRGDFNVANRTIGTTSRRWTFPDDYDPSSPTAPSGTGTIGSFTGSVVFGDPNPATGTTPTVYVAANQGRVYALNALGDPTTTRTGIRWQFPVAGQVNLPHITMTPTLFTPTGGTSRLLFGTLFDDTNEGPGQFYCLNTANGTPIWAYNDQRTTGALGNPDARVANTNLDSFSAGPVAVDATTLGQNRTTLTRAAGALPVLYDTVYVLNQNGYLFGLKVSDGTLVSDDLASGATGSHVYITSILDALTAQNLTFTFASDNVRGAALGDLPQTVPMIVIPGSNGVLAEMFARPEDYNAYTDLITDIDNPSAAYDFRSVDGTFASASSTPNPLTSAAASNNFLFVNDAQGILYALDGSNDTSNLNPNIDYGYRRGISPNDPRGEAFRHLMIRLINRDGYNRLKQTPTAGSNQGPLTYAQATTDATIDKNYGTTSTATGAASNPYAFEWGETAYVLVYNFPYATGQIASDGTIDTTKPVAPPDITVTFSVEGRVLRAPTVGSKQFANPAASPQVGGLPADGYAVVSYAFNNSGNSALPPGSGKISATVQTAALGGGAPVSVPQPRRGGSTIYFVTANPLAVTVANPTNGGLSTQTIGGGPSLSDGTAPENVVNGTPNTGASADGKYPAKLYESQLNTYTPLANHGTSALTRVYVYDRSLIVLLHEDGLSNFRVTRSNLQRQGGLAGVYQSLNRIRYPGFEDTPTTDGTNTSLDYPDIGREQVRAALGANGSTENPITVSSTLLPPTIVLSGSTTAVPVTIDNYDKGTRQPTPTPLDFTIDVPRYQPPVNVPAMPVTGSATDVPRDLIDQRHDSTGGIIPIQGYIGRVQAFIDSNNDNKLSNDTKETFRSFNMTTGVAPQWSVLTGTPTVDLGNLAAGTGYEPASPATAYAASGHDAKFAPWLKTTGVIDWSGAFKPIIVRNDGNVNLLDLRPAKAFQNGTTAPVVPWALPTADNDPLAWMTGALRNTGGNLIPGDLWSNFDSTYGAINRFDTTTENRAILPKPRVTDRVPTELVANPYPRANPNLALLNGAVVDRATNPTARLVNGSVDNRLNSSPFYPASAPKVAVSVPLGFPVGNYSAQIRVVENLLGSNDILEAANNVSEVYSDPITVTYKVRETRMTNGTTARTATVIDPLVPNGTNLIPTTYRNAAPTALRDSFGQLVVAWESDREATTNAIAQVTGPKPSRIFLANAKSGAGQNGSAAPAGNPPLWDLSQFQGVATDRWFDVKAGFPAAGLDSSLFPNAIGGTVSYGSPSFPQRGVIQPLSPQSTFGVVDMAFVGDAQVTTGTGRITQSKVFMTTMTPSTTGGAVLGNNPIDLGGDPQTRKGKPSVVQLGAANGSGTPGAALVFFSETGAGQSSITVSRLGSDGKATTTPLGFGDGFSSVFSPSANARRYLGANAGLSAGGNGAIIDLSFAGKLRGRANAEVYLGRLRLNPTSGVLQDSAGNSIEGPNAGSPFALLPQQSNERTVSEGNGVYRARGVNWSRTSSIAVQQLINGVGQSVLVESTKAVDRQSGLIAYDSRLGGKVYIDPELGTVRFASAFPNRAAEIRVTYTPYFLRITPGGAAGYSAVNGLWDDRYALDIDTTSQNTTAPAYWYSGTGTYTNSTGNATAASGIRNDRYFFAYGRGAAGGGLTARPYTTTMRLGIRLPTRVATDGQGNVASIQVTGAQRPYQVDPANGRVYFMAEDEDNPNIVITYTGVNEATNGFVAGIQVKGVNPSFVLERNETPVAVDEAANDTALSAFVDPFTSPSNPRPPLYWLFYVSTRGGSPDLYFQSIAPRYTPFAK